MPKELQNDEQIIYGMIAGRMLEAFSKKCIKDATTIVFAGADTLFEAKGSVIKQAGWRGILGEIEDMEETGDGETGNLPEVREDDVLPVIQSELLEKQTKPKPLHTEASLLGAMESCGREIENEAKR